MRYRKQIILTVIVCVTLILLFGVALGVSTYAHTDYQEQLHEAAEYCRNELGWGDNSNVIQALQRRWKEEERKIEILITVIGNEAPWCTVEHQELVAQVVVNRVNSPLFPNTIEEVVDAPGQYHPDYTDEDSHLWKRVREDPELYTACRAAAERVLNGEVDCPANVLWQANFPQGDGVYKKIYVDTGWFRSTTYFCYTEEEA